MGATHAGSGLRDQLPAALRVATEAMQGEPLHWKVGDCLEAGHRKCEQ